ncbi:MAG: M20 aminoacylase family protein [Rhodospirillales bacterium]
MPLIGDIATSQDQLTRWRRKLHAHPETAFEEHETARFVADRLRAFGVDVCEGLAGTGVVGTLVNGDGPAIGLRADLDALEIAERNTFAHRSTREGKMHACGHDGHTVMLLGAARHLARTKAFHGTVHFIFQPAEENEAGGRAMVEDGLFRRFPVEAVYGLHNWPALDEGKIAVRAGPIMAACDLFEIELTGRGCHGAMPHLGSDVIVAAGSLLTALQTVVSRTIDPQRSAVLSVTQIHAGETWNVLPERAVLRGTTRAFQSAVQEALEAGIRAMATHVAEAHRCTARVEYQRRYPPTINSGEETERAARAASAVVGAEKVVRTADPSMGAEDFAFMLAERPGCYVWLGSRRGDSEPGLHNPRYDFNDRILPIGASYWVALVEQELA